VRDLYPTLKQDDPPRLKMIGHGICNNAVHIENENH